ncbi:hypothetical protein TcG_11477 [Trypanosoma cruzi]|nr:hypothetical protein TcG_11477 [Trypanosoma cruzi]
MSSCSVGTITRAAARRHQNTRAVRHPTRAAQLRPAGAAGSKGQSRLFRPAVSVALRAALARRGGRCATQPHCNACRRSSRGPQPPAATRGVQPTPTPPHYRPFSFCFIHVVCRFALSPTPKISAHLQKMEGTKRKGDTIPPSRSGPTLSSTHHHCRAGDRSHIAESTPQCAPHHLTVSNGLDVAMHRPAPFSHHSSAACPHKVANTIRVHTNPINTLTR